MAEINPPFALQNAGATHTAEGDRNMVAGLIAGQQVTTGLQSRGGVNMAIGGEFGVTQTSTPSMAVQVARGICYVPGTESIKQGVYCCVNDATVTLNVAAAHGSLPRIDSVIARVYDSAYSGATNTWALEIVTGTAASSPVAPTLPNNSLRLVNINVGAAVSSITNANLADVRPHLTTAGGIIVCNSGTKPTNADVAPGQAIWLTDLKQLEFNDNGSWIVRSLQQTIQTGNVSVTFSNKNSHSQVVTFPTAFSSVPKVFTNLNSAAGETARWGTRAFNISTTGFTLFAFYGSNETSLLSWSGIQVQWQAIT